jgi:hypothetical protein
MPHRRPDFPTSTAALIEEAQAARVAEHNRLSSPAFNLT